MYKLSDPRRDTKCWLRLGKVSGGGDSLPLHSLGFGHQAEYTEQPRSLRSGMNRLAGETEDGCGVLGTDRDQALSRVVRRPQELCDRGGIGGRPPRAGEED